jgi:hypothetical protein
MGDPVTWSNRNRLEADLALNGTADAVAGGTGIYSYAPGSGTVAYVNRLNLYVRDASKWQGEGYGAGSALSTGITLRTVDSIGTSCTLTPTPITTIGHWGLIAGVDVDQTDFTTGEDWFIVRMTFLKGGPALCLDGTSHGGSAAIELDIPDSVAHLTYHVAHIQGSLFDT